MMILKLLQIKQLNLKLMNLPNRLVSKPKKTQRLMITNIFGLMFTNHQKQQKILSIISGIKVIFLMMPVLQMHSITIPMPLQVLTHQVMELLKVDQQLLQLQEQKFQEMPQQLLFMLRHRKEQQILMIMKLLPSRLQISKKMNLQKL